jgi:hypothetical protein
MQHEDATSSPHRRLRALALAATVATGIGAFSVTGTARPAVHQHAALETTASASPSAIGCDDYWSRAETLTGIPREVQIGMTAIGYAAAGAPQPDPCIATG